MTGGLAWQNTNYSPSAGVQGSQRVAAAMLAGDLELFKFDKTNLTIQGSVFPALSTPGRVYSNTTLTYYIKFFGNFT